MTIKILLTVMGATSAVLAYMNVRLAKRNKREQQRAA